MKDKFVIDSIESLRVISNDKRLNILRRLVEAPHTADGLSEAINEPKNKLYYHLGQLEACGLIEVVASTRRRNLIEKTYRATARFYSVDRALFAHESGAEFFRESVNSTLDATAADISRILRSLAPGTNPRDVIHIGGRIARMRPEKRGEFIERLDALLDEFREESLDTKDASTFAFFLYPNDEPSG